MYQVSEWEDEDDYSQGPSMAEMEADVDMQVALLEERCLAFERQAESYASQVSELELNVAELSGHLQVLQDDLENKSAKNRHLTDEVFKKNKAINSLQDTIQDLHNTVEQKDDVIGRLEDYLTAECRRREDAEEDYQAVLREKESELAELGRACEADRRNLTLQMEEQTRLAQQIADMMQQEQETIRKERDMLMCELHGQQQLVCELQEALNQFPEDCKQRILELEAKLHELEEENAYLRLQDGSGRGREGAIHSRSDSWDGRRPDSISSQELRKHLDEMFENYELLAKEFEDYRGKQEAMEFEFETRVAALQMALGAKAAQEGHVKSLKAQHNRLQCHLNNERARCSGLEKHMLEVKGQLIAAESEIGALKVIAQSREESLFKCERDIVRLGGENCLLLEEIQKMQEGAGFGSPNSSVVHALRGKVVGLRSFLERTQQQAAGLKTGDKFQLAKLTGALGEAVHQTNNMLLALEKHSLDDVSESGDSVDTADHFGDESGSPVQPPYLSSTHMQAVEGELRAILAKSGFSLGHNNPKQRIQYHLRLKQEMEEMRKECVGLLKEKFHLEQCIRYLAARSRLPVAACFPQDVSCRYPRPPSDSISPSSLISSINYSTPTGRQLLLRGSRGSATLGRNLSPYKPRHSMEDAIRRVQNDTVREARDLLHDFHDVKMCHSRMKECKHTIERRILSKVSSVCQSCYPPPRAHSTMGITGAMGVSGNN